MKKEEYLKIIETLENVKKEIKLLDGTKRTRKIKIKLKRLKRQEKEYTNLINNFNGVFIEEKCDNLEVKESEKVVIKKQNSFFKGIKKRILSVAALIATATSIIAGGVSFSASAESKEDPSVDKYYSVTQTNNSKQNNEENKKEIESKNETKEELKEEKGIKVSYMDFDTFIYNSKFTIDKDADIYTNVYDVHNKSNGLEPYYDCNLKRETKGVTIEIDGQLKYFTIDSDNSYNEMHSLLKKGGCVVSIVTSIDGKNCEGAYDISDVDLIYQTTNSKVLKK